MKLELKQLEVEAFGGISPSGPVVIDFTEANFQVVKGDQGTCKTSLLSAMLAACGQMVVGGEKGHQFINNESGSADVSLEFKGTDGGDYRVQVTKSAFKLMYEGKAVTEPKAKLKELLGVVGISPMEIKRKSVGDQIDWLASYSKQSAEDFKKKIKKFSDAKKEAEKSRADANRSLKGLNELLENDPMYNDWEGSEKLYAVKPDIDALSLELQQARDADDKLVRAIQKVDGFIKEKENVLKEIQRLKDLIVLEEEKLKTIESSIATGQSFVKANEGAATKYSEVQVRYNSIATEMVTWNKWQDIKQKKKERDEFETHSQNFDIKAVEAKDKIKALQAELLPDIKGVELYSEDDIVDGEPVRAGIYWKGRRAAQQSESEWFGLVMQIWKKYKVNIIVIDNAQDLGSKATEILRSLANQGAYILAAEMDRDQKELIVTYE